MAKRRKQTAAERKAAAAARYERHKAKTRADQAFDRESGQDIGEIPPVADPIRRAAALSSCQAFLDTYFKARFPLPSSEDQREIIATCDGVVSNGGKHWLVAPRGTGKTSIAEGVVLYAICSGKRNYVPFFHSKLSLASESLNSIKRAIMTNVLLQADFPELCFPFQKLDGQANRAGGQRYRGKKTGIVWRTNKIITAAIPGHACSECVIEVAGVGASIAGMKHSRMDGSIIRPDLCIVDDIQKIKQSADRVRQLIELVNSIIGGLSGPDVSLAVIGLGTVRSADDVCTHFLDRTKSPQWAGRKYKMLYAFPERMDLWDEYATRRGDELRGGGDGGMAVAWYLEHREAMDAGARVAWPANTKERASALLLAMELFFFDRATFFSEYQNEPIEDNSGDGPQLVKAELAKRNNGLDRGRVPLNATRITAFIDTSHKYLTFAVGAWSDTFDGGLIDYGSHPDQGRRYFTKQNAQRTLGRASPGAGLEAATLAGLEALVGSLLSREWKSESNAALRIERLLIDANDGAVTDTVYDFCRRSSHGAIVMPSHGRGVLVTSKPWHEYTKRPGERLGVHWLIPAGAGKRAVKHCIIDVNWWKSFIAQRLMIAPGDRGALTFFGEKGFAHDMLIDHLCSEFRKSPSWRGRTVDQWEIKPEAAGENDLWDAVVGCAVAASIQGAELPGTGGAKPKGVKVSYAEMYARANAAKSG